MSTKSNEDAIQPKSLERALARAKELERIGDQSVEDEEAYRLCAIAAFPGALALARYDVPLLVDEIKRLRGWERGTRMRRGARG
jgi:hypothetical protein